MDPTVGRGQIPTILEEAQKTGTAMIPEVRYTLQDQTLGALLKYKCIQSLKASIDIVVSVRKLSFELNFKI